MANYTTSADILDSALDKAGEPKDGTSDFNTLAIDSLNKNYQRIYSGGSELAEDVHEAWWWLRSALPGVITIEPSIQDLTANVTNNSTSVTLSSTVSKDLDNWFVKFGGIADVFRVSAHTAGSAALTLDSVFTGPTNTADSCKLYKLEYDLPSDLVSVISPMRAYQDDVLKITGASLRDLTEIYPLTTIDGGVPRLFAMVSNSRVRFSHFGGDTSTELIRVDFDYLLKPTDLADDTNQPLIPREFRSVLADFVTFDVLIAKDDDRAEGVGKQAQAALRSMARENRLRWQRTSDEFATVRPRAPRGVRYGPLRTEQGFIIG